jgi:hypothetical protein
MNKILPIRLKAAFLTLIFTGNVICWGCPMGMCMCGRSSESAKINEGCKNNNCLGKKECCPKEKKSTENQGTSKGCHDNHCKNNIINFSKVDKSCAESIEMVSIIFFTAFISSFYNIDILYIFEGTTNIKYFLQNYHPPIPDIRLAIRSFQI